MYDATSESGAVVPPRRRKMRWGWLAIAILAAVVLAFVPNIGPIFRLVEVPSASMVPTIYPGSFLVVSRVSYGLGRAPARGDLIALQDPSYPEAIHIDRVIGIGGDTVRLENHELFIDGVKAPRVAQAPIANATSDKERVAAQTYRETLPGGASYRIAEITSPDWHFKYADMAETTVPEGKLFVMGDNRDNARDSRVPLAENGLGLVPQDSVIGKVIWVLGGSKPD